MVEAGCAATGDFVLAAGLLLEIFKFGREVYEGFAKKPWDLPHKDDLPGK